MSQFLSLVFDPLMYYPAWVLWVFFIATVLLVIGALVWICDGVFDFVDDVDPNGLKRHFFFKWGSYEAIIRITIALAAGFISAVLLMVAIGGLSWLVLWIVKILSYTVYYVFGWAFLVIGILGTLAGAWECLLMAIIGGLVVYWGEPIQAFAEACVVWGEELWLNFNIFYLAKDIVLAYWPTGLGIVLTPLTIFLVIAIVWMIVAFSLRFYDWATTRYYSVHHPCPYCQENSEPALYYSYGMPLNTRLRPGVYGLFHIQHPETRESMPTLLMNGRSTLVRQCCKCGAFINSETGVDKHIAMVGGPGSGKSALSLTMLGKLKSSCRGLVIGGDVDVELKDLIDRIATNGKIGIDEFPNKTAAGVIPSLRANIVREGRPPYALYLNDIAGELFQPGAEIGDALKFLYNTTSLVFLIDPTTAILSNASSKIKKWAEAHRNLINPTTNMEDVYACVRTHINEINRLNKMTINYVLVKTDTGYLGDVDACDADALKRFIAEELGIPGVLSNGEFAHEQFFAVSTVVADGHVDALNKALMEQQNILNA